MIALVWLLLLLGAPAGTWAEDVTVSFQQDGPEGILGVACHRDFLAVTGNAQALCEGMPDDSMILFLDAIPTRRTLLATLRHESCHLALGVVDGETAWERFSEARCYRVGNAYGWRYR